MSVYNYTVNLVTARLLPPLLRVAKQIAWLRVLGTPFQWNVDRLNKFNDGDNSIDWDIATNYSIYDTVRWSDNSIYESRVSSNLGVKPTGDTLSATNWYKVQDHYIGINERVRYNGQIIVLAYALNRQFRITSAPFIYVEQLSPTFEVYVPLAVYNALAGNNTDRSRIVQAFCDKLKPGGSTCHVNSF